ncbi:aldose epimerase family protein [uncultured Roseobacter sp.]|uniref:aldose epimerase family protein n=1 Tax=uncultured Roseobacter sp. TaxID=114847 RepID=UPI00260BC82E|nr:aldose epimerase family protein [uncultured Roseobacter sp.]
MIFLQSDTLRAQIFPEGATLGGLWLRDKVSHSLVLGTATGAGYDSDLVYAGAIVGPVANRLRDARARLGDQILTLPANDGAHSLHGGPGGLHRDIWQVEHETQDSVVLSTRRVDGAGGMPGNRDFSVRYSLEAAMCLSVTITVSTDTDTLISPAHHPYWNLDGSHDVSGHRLQVMADNYLPVDGDTLPTGRVADVAETSYDFRTPRAVPVDQTLDANLCLAENRRRDPVAVAHLTGGYGTAMTIETTEPGLQVYNGSGLPQSDLVLHDNRRPQPFAGIALEPQGWPDAPNQPHFPSVLLRRSQQYRQVTRYLFSV